MRVCMFVVDLHTGWEEAEGRKPAAESTMAKANVDIAPDAIDPIRVWFSAQIPAAEQPRMKPNTCRTCSGRSAAREACSRATSRRGASSASAEPWWPGELARRRRMPDIHVMSTTGLTAPSPALAAAAGHAPTVIATTAVRMTIT